MTTYLRRGENSQFVEGDNLAENDLEEGEENFENVNSDTGNEFAENGQGNQFQQQDDFANQNQFGQQDDFAEVNNAVGNEFGENFAQNQQLQFGNQQQGFQDDLEAGGENINNANTQDALFNDGMQTNTQNAAIDSLNPVSCQRRYEEGGRVKYDFW